MGLTNLILYNIIGRVFRHLPRGGEGKNSISKVIKSNQGIILIKSDQIIELLKSNQEMGLIKSNQNIQS